MSTTLQTQFESAMQTYLSGELEPASQAFASITSTWPECIEAWFQRADIAEHQQQWEQAVEYYEKVLEQRQDIQEVWFRLGRIAVQQNALSMAETYWKQALLINPAYAEPHLHLGLFYARTDQRERAVQHLRSARFLDPGLDLALLVVQMQRQQQPQIADIIQSSLKRAVYQGLEPLHLGVLLNKTGPDFQTISSYLNTLPSRLWRITLFVTNAYPHALPEVSKAQPIQFLQLSSETHEQVMGLYAHEPHILWAKSDQPVTSLWHQLMPEHLLWSHALPEPEQNALHLHRWAVHLRHAFLRHQRTST